MGKLVRSMDWANTPLGPLDSWPQSLRTTVGLCLASNFPISIAWGPHHVQIYNDGYWPICGAKHPVSMGQDFSICWASAWPAIGEAFERALAGNTSYLENQRMFLDRNGYLEETFFTFSFSPIRDETGGVAGLFHPVTETTTKMVGERQASALRDLPARASKAQTIEEALRLSAETLSEFDLDLPFVLFYLLDPDTQEATLMAESGSLPRKLAVSTILLDSSASIWPLAEVAASGFPVQINDLAIRAGEFTCGPYPESPKIAIALPITLPGHNRPLAIIVAGVSSRLPLNETYRTYYDLIASTVTSAVANASAYEQERQRAEALAEIDRAKTTFFSNVSHEFRTPLTLMLGPLEDELSDNSTLLPPERRQRIETAHRNTLRLMKLVNSLLDFSRIEAGRLQASYQPVDLATYTAELASVFRSTIEKAGLTLSVHCPPLPELLFVDRDMWEKIVLNLLSNAFKHTFEGEIFVKLQFCGNHVELIVADSGVGIPASELPHLFERFHRVKGARSRTFEGSGIGLALVQELVRAHCGSLRVESEEGKGTRFFVTLPTGSQHLPADRVGASPSHAATSIVTSAHVEETRHWISETVTQNEASIGSNGSQDSKRIPAGGPQTNSLSKILWADDNTDMRDYVSRLLTPYYNVIAVADGEAALSSAMLDPPDLVLSDVMMPRLDGFGLLERLRADERTRTVPVILLSARAGEEAAVEGLNCGADDYLVKPFSARELLARIRTHVELAKMRRNWALELEAANKELEAFAHSVSHDLRGPLRAIDGFSSLLAKECSSQISEESLDLLKLLRNSVKNMQQLIEDLLRFSRLGRKPLSKEPVKLIAIIQEVLEEIRSQGNGNKNVNVTLEHVPDCFGDSALLKQVFVNLLSNAFKFTAQKQEPIVEVGCRQSDGLNVYFVRDNGAGFDMRHADKLFGVFQRLHSLHEFEGTGLGLSIVHRIIQRHGGKIWAEAEVDKGASFHFTLSE